MLRCAPLIAVVALLAGCSPFSKSYVRASKGFSKAAVEFRKENARFPRSFAELNAFAKEERISLDYRCFETLDLVSGRDIFSISYIGRTGRGQPVMGGISIGAGGGSSHCGTAR